MGLASPKINGDNVRIMLRVAVPTGREMQLRKEMFMHWYVETLKKYAVFGGRARRTEYWMFFLINLIVTIGLTVVDNVTGLTRQTNGVGLLQPLYSLFVFLPGLGVTVRRLHDTGHSGLWILLAFIPCIGALVLLIWMVTPSDPGINAYGPSPLGSTARLEG